MIAPHTSKVVRALLVLACFLGTGNSLAAQDITDVVYLKNGDVLRGVIVEEVPYESIKMELPGGSTITVSYEDIARIVRERPRPITPQGQGDAPGVDGAQGRAGDGERTTVGSASTLMSIGYGNSFGGFGVELSFDVSANAALHVGGGYFPLSSLHDGASDMVMGAGGIRLFLATSGNARRYLDLQFGVLGGEYSATIVTQGGEVVFEANEQKILYGPSVLLGTEALWGESRTIGGRIAGGGSYNIADVAVLDSDFLWAIDMGVATFGRRLSGCDWGVWRLVGWVSG